MKKFETYYRIQKHDSKGNLISDTGLIQSHSYVIQFLELIEAWMGVRDKTATDVTGAESVLMDISDNNNTKALVTGPDDDDTYGIVVGTNDGASPEANDDFALDTKIAHSGIGAAGTLNYEAQGFTPTAVVGANVDFILTRAFVNQSGNPITVKEVGIICKNLTDTKYHLMLRDVVSDEVVGGAQTLTVAYTLRTTA